MSNVVAVWNGTAEDLHRLDSAVARNCGCDPDHQFQCWPHRMMLDQATLDRMAFLASMRQRMMQGDTQAYAEYNSTHGDPEAFATTLDDQRYDEPTLEQQAQD